MTTLLQVKKLAADIQAYYDQDPTTRTFNALIHGPVKVGKTTLLSTCTKPVLVHSFDPGGTEVLKPWIEKGEILVDTEFEKEDPYKPSAFALWEHKFNKLRHAKFFDHVGTFAIDSMTTWAQCIMWDVIAKAAKVSKKRVVGGHPHRDDWLPQMQKIENYMRIFVSLPCHCVLLGHSDQQTDSEGNVIGPKTLMVTGKLKERIPALFSEIYYLEMTNPRKKERKLHTVSSFDILAGTRLGKGGLLEDQEVPDIKAILRKVNMDSTDKPLFKDLDEGENENG
jgi:hypothetical protein